MKNILVIRNDKLGDFVLAWPAFAMLKKSLPSTKITALVPSYTAELAQACPYIDEVIIDAGKNGDKAAKQQTLLTIKQKSFDAAIAFFSDRYNATLLWKAKIPYRLAPATKIIQFLYNDRLIQHRSRSEQPEFVYNLELSRYFLVKQGINVIEPNLPYFEFDESILAEQRQKLIQQLNLSLHKKWCFIHAGTGGSAKNLTLNQYAQLANFILEHFACQIILTAGKGEEEQALELQKLINSKDTIVYAKNDGLVDFARSIACCDVFIAGSTGPLHLAAALNKAVIGFYPSKRSACALRWRPINADDKHLLISADPNNPEEIQMSKIDISQVVTLATSFLTQFLR
ncbi:hypothetical protein QV08_09365 [Gallibacterium salpingitidis]|uniref:glycosyltransferase family 9 protein n=1 Tax=Gallibacterium salpingitidis TaxID=505341 RepID=UPI0008054A9A|nr:glycosyltransferase family 9 protein [Gallibacterium salpingitidis]OBX06743.1 hypothetical protein QV08_09365 [Gallibacterium salpingitidis]